jgi:hypothetical protein
MDWQNKFDQELEMAGAARGRGNEGQARVCARRAAGVAVREYFQRLGRSARSQGAYDLLAELLLIEALPGRARQAAENLTLRVSEEFKLPDGIDLIADARALAVSLIPAN